MKSMPRKTMFTVKQPHSSVLPGKVEFLIYSVKYHQIEETIPLAGNWDNNSHWNNFIVVPTNQPKGIKKFVSKSLPQLFASFFLLAVCCTAVEKPLSHYQRISVSPLFCLQEFCETKHHLAQQIQKEPTLQRWEIWHTGVYSPWLSQAKSLLFCAFTLLRSLVNVMSSMHVIIDNSEKFTWHSEINLK